MMLSVSHDCDTLAKERGKGIVSHLARFKGKLAVLYLPPPANMTLDFDVVGRVAKDEASD